MTGPWEDKLSAYLDGELSDTDMRDIEAELTRDPHLQDTLNTLVSVEDDIRQAFEAQLEIPVPDYLQEAVRSAPTQTPANSGGAPRRMLWMSAAAALVALVIGGGGGFYFGTQGGSDGSEMPIWLSDIADYHGVYAGQKRHLVEVPASEADHIETWLTGTIGSQVTIPDLTDQGLIFQGARLLVAAGKPVSQLMYTDAQGRVVALCQIQTAQPRSGFADRQVETFHLVSWGGSDANFVIIGDKDRTDLTAIAQSAAAQV